MSIFNFDVLHGASLQSAQCCDDLNAPVGWIPEKMTLCLTLELLLLADRGALEQLASALPVLKVLSTLAIV
jgi:hypothetical protein